ncbi:D-TA family PLP-dependent enzyme [Olivibacter ginsenosidimutans]|uniref:D-TA family PLP-dependent enzyme n=1 Tax=Olivibacter ginsenosidimutans TaxID=1176537 RepID=A0ABP9C8M9_9SPHI
MLQKAETPWYTIQNIADIPSPALVVYPHRVEENIRKLLAMAGSVDRLRPHIKTCKSAEAISLLKAAGIYQYKCATIAEAELLGVCGVKDVLLAYQPVGPNILRFISLIKRFPTTIFSCLIDCSTIAQELHQQALVNNLIVHYYIDINVGMNRTGIMPNEVMELVEQCQRLSHIKLLGLHCYDGHIHNISLHEREKKCTDYFATIRQLMLNLQNEYGIDVAVVAGGSPTFPIHIKQAHVVCSPGTFVFWDKGYGDLLHEQSFLPAALLVTRVISTIDRQTLCLDLGHKAIAAENDLSKRVFFINAPEARAVAQSEEHLVVSVPNACAYPIGSVFFGIPYHICPTVALYDEAYAIVDQKWDGNWTIAARKRKLSI